MGLFGTIIVAGLFIKYFDEIISIFIAGVASIAFALGDAAEKNSAAKAAATANVNIAEPTPEPVAKKKFWTRGKKICAWVIIIFLVLLNN